uniref:Pcna1 n=1 Tax=Arundo donax TaxID=35708 RepID=A0A0A9DRD1_ARUDO
MTHEQGISFFSWARYVAKCCSKRDGNGQALGLAFGDTELRNGVQQDGVCIKNIANLFQVGTLPSIHLLNNCNIIKSLSFTDFNLLCNTWVELVYYQCCAVPSENKVSQQPICDELLVFRLLIPQLNHNSSIYGKGTFFIPMKNLMAKLKRANSIMHKDKPTNLNSL